MFRKIIDNYLNYLHCIILFAYDDEDNDAIVEEGLDTGVFMWIVSDQ